MTESSDPCLDLVEIEQELERSQFIENPDDDGTLVRYICYRKMELCLPSGKDYNPEEGAAGGPPCPHCAGKFVQDAPLCPLCCGLGSEELYQDRLWLRTAGDELTGLDAHYRIEKGPWSWLFSIYRTADVDEFCWALVQGAYQREPQTWHYRGSREAMQKLLPEQLARGAVIECYGDGFEPSDALKEFFGFSLGGRTDCWLVDPDDVCVKR
jgi:hypothetical protein